MITALIALAAAAIGYRTGVGIERARHMLERAEGLVAVSGERP